MLHQFKVSKMKENFMDFEGQPVKIGVFPSGTMVPVEPVSYTHLDVYKRQDFIYSASL